VIGETDKSLLAFGATYHCPGQPPACGFEIREIATDLIDPNDASLAEALGQARHDVTLTVRMSALRRIARAIPQTKRCAPIVQAMNDASEPVIFHLEAMSRLDPACEDRADVATQLSARAARLSDPRSATDWHEPARALETLARFDPEAARKLIDGAAIAHPIWQVRAAAARAAVTLKDEALLLRFADDREPNVRNEALTGLAAQGSAQTTAVALKALASPDYQLVRTAAESLKKRPASRDEIQPLLVAFRRLTAEGKDTSRDPRTSILGRLRMLADQKDPGGDSWLRASAATDLTAALKDFDPTIAQRAAEVIGAATGTTPEPNPTRRPLEQPSEAEVGHLPKRAIITLDNRDRIEMTFLTSEAPVTIARFAKMARAGYYNGLTFHRIEPLFVVQGGSPGANEYMGAPRYLRDEIGVEHHTTGAVGLSTRGRDTADGQIFIDLTDQYRLDYTYTVFARVKDMGPVGRMLEGARIVSVEIG
jgi:cyclophilin family peptidyl-prolyl cis-trans isomerase